MRELQNSVKRIVLLADGERVEIADFTDSSDNNKKPEANNFESLYTSGYNDAKAEIITRFSTSYLRNLLTKHGGNVTNAATDCCLERQALQRIMRRYSIISSDFKQK